MYDIIYGFDIFIEECLPEVIERDPYPPYRERLHPRKHWQRKPYWLRTRSNPKKKAIIKPKSLNANEVNELRK